ncbi:27478_t:CDS:2, partial [Dentiscutata erythropus]
FILGIFEKHSEKIPLNSMRKKRPYCEQIEHPIAMNIKLGADADTEMMQEIEAWTNNTKLKLWGTKYK